jgi:transcriptional regulator with XRE-family HTH domain
MSSTAHRVQVGAELRRIREETGLSGVQVAAALGWSQSKVSRIEGGRLRTTLNDLLAVLALYEVPEEVRAELLSVAVARDGLPGAWIVRAGGPSRRQGEVAAIEKRVKRIRQYAAVTVPGLLQCESYTRAIAIAGGFVDVEDIVTRRRARQEILDAASAPALDVVLDERSLQRWPGDADVLDDQLLHLLRLGALPNVRIRVLPNGPALGDCVSIGQFLMYDFRDPAAPAVVMLESQTADAYLSATEDLKAYSKLFDNLVRVSLSVAKSAHHLRSMATRSSHN